MQQDQIIMTSLLCNQLFNRLVAAVQDNLNTFRSHELYVPQDPRAELRRTRRLLRPLHRPLRQTPILRRPAAFVTSGQKWNFSHVSELSIRYSRNLDHARDLFHMISVENFLFKNFVVESQPF